MSRKKKKSKERRMNDTPALPAPQEPRNLLYLDYNLLKQRCHQTIDSFRNYGEVTETNDGIYIYRRTEGAKILAVAHLDVVAQVRESTEFYQETKYIYGGQMDDRLGVHLLLDVLPTWGLKYDLLLTENEEVGRSTARHFKLPEGVEYNWMFELDRMGANAVMYQYHTTEYSKMLEDYGFKTGIGSCTDIKYLEGLGIFGVNFGIAYYSPHQVKSYVDTAELEETILPMIVKFIGDRKDEKLVHVPKVTTSYGASNASYGGHNTVYDRFGGGDDYDDEAYWTRFAKDKPRNLPMRFQFDNLTEKWYCPLCGKEFKDCGTYYNCSSRASRVTRLAENSTINNGCNVCNREVGMCSGFAECPMCEFQYHNSPHVSAFGLCYSCLGRYFEVPELFLVSFLSYDKETRDLAERHILNTIGGKYVGTVTIKRDS